MSAPRRAQVSNEGFTLIEAMVAMFVLAVGLLGCASLLSWSLFQGSAALRREHALVIASDLAERVRANGVAPDAAEFTAWQSQITSHLPGLAALESSLAVFPPTNSDGLERIDITVRWREPRTPSGIASLVLRIHRRPVAT